jgi:hypothetical protein
MPPLLLPLLLLLLVVVPQQPCPGQSHCACMPLYGLWW